MLLARPAASPASLLPARPPPACAGGNKKRVPVPVSMVKQIAGRAGRRSSQWAQGLATCLNPGDVPRLQEALDVSRVAGWAGGWPRAAVSAAGAAGAATAVAAEAGRTPAAAEVGACCSASQPSERCRCPLCAPTVLIPSPSPAQVPLEALANPRAGLFPEFEHLEVFAGQRPDEPYRHARACAEPAPCAAPAAAPAGASVDTLSPSDSALPTRCGAARCWDSQGRGAAGLQLPATAPPHLPTPTLVQLAAALLRVRGAAGLLLLLLPPGRGGGGGRPAGPGGLPWPGAPLLDEGGERGRPSACQGVAVEVAALLGPAATCLVL